MRKLMIVGILCLVCLGYFVGRQIALLESASELYEANKRALIYGELLEEYVRYYGPIPKQNKNRSFKNPGELRLETEPLCVGPI